MKTKEKILAAALKLFNEHGLKNVRLQHIADKAGISVGNLAYHFPDKKQLLRKVENTIGEEVELQSTNWKNSPHLIDFDNRLIQLFHLMNKYSFYFLDALEIQRTYPTLHLKRRDHINHLIREITLWLNIQAEQQTIKEDPQNMNFARMAEMIWFISAFWLLKDRILDKLEENEMAFREAVWSQIRPYFSEKSLIEYEAMIMPRLYY